LCLNHQINIADQPIQYIKINEKIIACLKFSLVGESLSKVN
jgi:hypothetical protein